MKNEVQRSLGGQTEFQRGDKARTSVWKLPLTDPWGLSLTCKVPCRCSSLSEILLSKPSGMPKLVALHNWVLSLGAVESEMRP